MGILFTGTQDGGSSNTTMTDSTASFEVDGLIGMYIKNTTTGKYGLITDNTATTVITSSQSGFWVNGQAYRIEGTTLTGVTGWTDSGSCTINHAVENGSIVVTNGGGNYSSAPSVSLQHLSWWYTSYWYCCYEWFWEYSEYCRYYNVQ